MNFLKAAKSFKFALQGLKWLVASENNFQIHLLATFLVIMAGFLLKINQTEWLVILLLCGLVWAAEAFNTAIEKLCDFIHPAQNKQIGQIKDLAAAAVLVMAIVAAIIGLIIFLPKIFNIFQS